MDKTQLHLPATCNPSCHGIDHLDSFTEEWLPPTEAPWCPMVLVHAKA